MTYDLERDRIPAMGEPPRFRQGEPESPILDIPTADAQWRTAMRRLRSEVLDAELTRHFATTTGA